MSDLLIRNIPPALKRQLEDRARKHKRSLSAEAQLLRKGLAVPADDRKLGTLLFNLIPRSSEATITCSSMRTKSRLHPTSNELAPHEYARKLSPIRVPH